MDTNSTSSHAVNDVVHRPGVSNESLAANGIGRVNGLYAAKYIGYETSGILIPYHNIDGTPLIINSKPFARVRLDAPVNAKYLSPKGGGSQLYIPVGLKAADRCLILCEGEFKALSLSECGYPAVGLGGICGAMPKGTLLPALRHIIEQGEITKVYFLGDADSAFIHNFAREAVKLANGLPSLEVYIPMIGLNDGGNGIDDVKDSFTGTFERYFNQILKDAISVPATTDADTLAIGLARRAMRETLSPRIEGKLLRLLGDLDEFNREKLIIPSAAAINVSVRALRKKLYEEKEKLNAVRVENNPMCISGPANIDDVIKQLDIYWLDGSDAYFVQTRQGGDRRYYEMTTSQIKRKLKTLGIGGAAENEYTDTTSPADKLLVEVNDTRAVDCSANVAGYEAGVYEMAGRAILVKQSPEIILPGAGTPSVILRFLKGLLGDVQTMYFILWLKLAYESLVAASFRPGQALILVGPPNCGKSRIQNNIITKVLGGRHSDPKSHFFGRTDFNSELVAAEHLMIEEVPSSIKYNDRVFFGEKIKEVAANESHRLHIKGVDALTVNPFWRLSISVNDNPEKLKSLPPLTDDIIDKIMLFSVKPYPEFWQEFENEKDPRKAFATAIENELPSFIEVLRNTIVMEEYYGRRFGVKSYVDDDIAEKLYDAESDCYFLLLIDKALWKSGKPFWEGDAEDLFQLLSLEDSGVAVSVRKFLSNGNHCGQLLAKLHTRYPGRFSYRRTNQKRLWHILCP